MDVVKTHGVQQGNVWPAALSLSDMESVASTTWTITLALVALRVMGIFLVAPVVGHAAMPLRLRYFLAVVIALSVVGQVAQPVNLPAGNVQQLLLLTGELLIGLVIGFTARLVFVGMELGALQISQQMGIALGEVFNPIASQEGGVMRRFFHLLTAVLFLAMGGHHTLIDAVIRTFAAVPVFEMSKTTSMLSMVVSILAVSFALALKVAGPVLITLVLATVVMGLLQRAVPQCNILSTGLPARLLIGMAVLAISVAAITTLVSVAFENVWQQISANLLN